MSVRKILIVHVGNMNNKGTQALLKSDVSVIREGLGTETRLYVSTPDIDGVRRLNLPLQDVFPSVLDIPYEKADYFARRLGFKRRSWRYKVFALASLITVFVQMVFSVFSSFLVKIGLRGFYRNELLESFSKCDMVVSYSDENFKETASLLPLNPYWVLTWWSMLISRTWDVLVAKYFGKPVVMFPNSIGPFRTSLGRFLARMALKNCDLVLVRDPISYEIANSLAASVPKILTSDTTFLFVSTGKELGETVQHPCVGVSPGVYAHVYSEKSILGHVFSYAKALDRAVDEFGLNVVFIPHYISGFDYDDLRISEMIVQNMKNSSRARIVKMESVDGFNLLLHRMDMMISAKMHPAVLALSGKIPTVCVAYDHKQIGLFESINMTECVVPISEFSDAALFSKVSYVWKNRASIRNQLCARIPLVQNNVKRAVDFALDTYLPSA